MKNDRETKKTIRVMMVEDLERWQMAIQALIDTMPGFELVGLADNYADALTLYHTQQPDIALLDFQILGDKSGLDVAHVLAEQGLPVECIAIVSSSSPQTIGEHPYLFVPKNRVAEQLPVTLCGMAACV